MYFSNVAKAIRNAETVSTIGKIENVIGMSIEASGLKARVGDIARVLTKAGTEGVAVEVVGFKDEATILMPYNDLGGVAPGDFVRSTGKTLEVPVGDFLMGRVVDALCNPIDDLGPFGKSQTYPVGATYINPLSRPPIKERLTFGIKAIDGLLTIGKGQRMGIFAGSGVGKSTLMGMIAKYGLADVNVIALVGERGREVKEFIQKELGPEGMRRSVVVVATSDQSSMQRMKCPMVATTIAEYFKNQGKDVLLMMDSLTRFAMAQREMGLAIGEPPIARGYTPSIYAELPKLLERSGNFDNGSITGIYTVLVEGDDTNEPISDTVRGIVDGHMVLSRKLAHRNHYPAIDVSQSISRLMNSLVSNEHKELASEFRDIMAIYEENADMVNIGAYKKGSNPRLDRALDKMAQVDAFLTQNVGESFSYEETLGAMKKILEK
ncbi:MAG: flagellar protein export ATPase FliI [Clostridia bacterium]|nr:flagellar protein export ATPase FliI [Clostridia bacterium]